MAADSMQQTAPLVSTIAHRRRCGCKPRKIGYIRLGFALAKGIEFLLRYIGGDVESFLSSIEFPERPQVNLGY
jgi:hypothetical protein